MASLQIHTINSQFRPTSKSSSPKPQHLQHFKFDQRLFSGKVKVFLNYPEENYRSKDNRFYSICCFCKTKDAEIEKVEAAEEQIERPPFDINLAVILAGFAFEAYTTPPEKIGRYEVDAAGCKTLYLSESFIREIYDGQLFIKLKKGLNFPAMDPWGTSDPYVVMELDGQVIKSKVKWATKEPTWNEDLTFNVKQPMARSLQVNKQKLFVPVDHLLESRFLCLPIGCYSRVDVARLGYSPAQIAAWDANLVAPHKRMGNAGLSLECLCDGNLHEVVVELEGMGGGGKLQLEVKYKSFDEIEEEKKWWMLPIVPEFLRKNGFESALNKFLGSQTVPARQFVEYAFGQLKSFNDSYLLKDPFSNSNDNDTEGPGTSENSAVMLDMASQMENSSEATSSNQEQINTDNDVMDNGHPPELLAQVNKPMQSDNHFWKDFADVISQNVVQKLGLPAPGKLKWNDLDLLEKVGLQSRKIAEAGYTESGLAAPEVQDVDNDKASDSFTITTIQSSLPDIKKATKDLVRQTDSLLGSLMVLTAAVSQLNTKEDTSDKIEDDASRHLKSEKFPSSMEGSVSDDKKAEEMKALFSTAESAMEAWAMLATSLGHPSFIKSEFEKLCFLDNASTDTQVAIWRDSAQRRLVVAFRGTEQARWKDLLTDLMLIPAGFNPERIGGDFKQEVQVHTGFLSAYDSVRIRIISLLKLSIGYTDDSSEPLHKWHVYVTGHSLGGALATLLALELSSSQLAKRGAISVTMYNFGSPRVGNKKFAEIYNEKVKDSWRVVNHRDIIPTVPRLMGYCHVSQPVYLTAGGALSDALENMELLNDGYEGDVIGEATPDVIVSEIMKGEMEFIEKILQTEINIFRSVRDGSAITQHMEDFYYISLLEHVKSNYKIVPSSENDEQSGISIS